MKINEKIQKSAIKLNEKVFEQSENSLISDDSSDDEEDDNVKKM